MRIVIEPSTPYLSPLNGVAERYNRTTLDKVRSMLADSGLHPWNWPEAAKAAAYVGNRIATKEDKTPWEKLTGRKPSVKHLRVWGAPCMVHTPLKIQDNKLAPRAEAGRMMGYEGDNTNGWRVLMGGKIYVRGGRIEFNEEEGAKPFVIDESAPPSEPSPLPPPSPPTSPSPAPLPTPSPDPSTLNPQPTVSDPMDSGPDFFAEGPPPLPSWRPIRTRPDGTPLSGRIPGSTSLQAFYLAATTPTNAHLDFEPANWTEATKCDEWEEWMEAAKDELDSLRNMQTFTEVPRLPGMKVIDSKWVFKHKRDSRGNIIRHKARITARGFRQTQGVDFNEVFAPVGSSSALRTMCSVAAGKDWKIHQLDFKTAFLNGSLEEEVYMEYPEGWYLYSGGDRACRVSRDHVLKLNKSLYGLKQAPRVWYTMLRDKLVSFGYTQSMADPGVFRRGDVYLLLYVDDQLIMGPSSKHIQDAIDEIKSEFVIDDMGPCNMFLGVAIERGDGFIKLHQERYTMALLEKYGVPLVSPGGKETPTPAISKSAKELEVTGGGGNFPYAELVGGLLYLSCWTRPDIAFAVGRLTRHMTTASVSDWNDAVRVLKYLACSANQGIVYMRDGGDLMGYSHDVQSVGDLLGYSDSDYAGDHSNRKSTSGVVFMLNGGPVVWKSKQQSTVALSTCEAEYVASNSAGREGIWLARLLKELDRPLSGPVKIMCDNKGALALLKNPISSSKSKHISIMHHWARERVERGELLFDYVESENNLADIFTKALEPKVFQGLKGKLVC
jgi:hypothetical protein